MKLPLKTNAVVTICALNYLAKALVLKDSYISSHVDSDFYILVIDKRNQDVIDRNPDVRFLWVEELGIPGFHHYAFKFDIIELSTNVKPTILSQLLKQYDTVLYIDPDIKVFAYLAPVYEALETHSIVVTPHTLTPVLDGCSPSDIDFLRFGAFNLGFVGVSRCDEGFAFLEWWSARCLEFGYYEPPAGLAVDQKWVDLAPCYFPSLKILREPGLNVAFWNLHERFFTQSGDAWQVNHLPLYFFHLSSFSLDEPHAIAHKQSRFASGSRPDIHGILDEYAKELLAHDNGFYESFQYAFDYLDTGEYISPTLRRFYAALEDRFPPGENPFQNGSAAHRFSLSKRLAVSNYRPTKRYTFKDLDKFASVIRISNFCLKIMLRLVGPNRYFSLMKFLVHVSSIRGQKDVITVD
jgi:hypothetical protein